MPEKRSVLCPVRLGHSRQLPTAGTSCASRLLNGASFQNEQNVLLDPALKLADGEQDAFCLVTIAPIFAEVMSERLFLFRGLQLCQEKRVAHADLVFEKGINRDGRKLGQSQTSHLCVAENYVQQELKNRRYGVLFHSVTSHK
jgi:hypothetical protein